MRGPGAMPCKGLLGQGKKSGVGKPPEGFKLLRMS